MSNYSVNVFSGQGVMGFAEGKGTKGEVLDFVTTLPDWFAKYEGWTGANVRLTIGRSKVGRFVSSMDEVIAFVGELTGQPPQVRRSVVPASPAQGGAGEGSVMNVVSVKGGKVHSEGLTMSGDPFPLCRTGSQSSGGTHYRRTDAPLTCKTCLTYEERRNAKAAAAKATSENSELVDAGTPESASVPPVSPTNEDHSGETMAEKTATKNDVNADHGKAVIEQIDANIERAKSLAEADNVDALTELHDETETLISSLSGQGSIKIKKAKRDAFTAAATVQEKPKKEVARKGAEGVIVAKSWDQYEGTTELVNMGAEKVAEGISAHVKVSNLAKEIAAISFDVWLRIPNKAGVPDLVGDSDAAKKGARAIYDKALPLFEDNYDNAQALKKLIRSAQDFRSDVRAEWLRSLDGDDEIAAERRAIVAKVLEDKPEDEKASEWVANVYSTSTLGQSEAKRIAYHEKKKAAELAAAKSEGSDAEGGEGEGEGEGSGETAETTTPDERATKVTEKLVRDIKTGKPEDFEAASEETRKAIRAKLEQAMEGIKAMITATL